MKYRQQHDYSEIIHVYPIVDYFFHHYDENCDCQPEIQWQDHQKLVIHNAFFDMWENPVYL